MRVWGHVSFVCVEVSFISALCSSYNLCWRRSFTQRRAVCELVKSDLKPHTGDSLSFNPGWSLALLYSHCIRRLSSQDIFHTPSCLWGRGGRAGEGKETEHSFEELGFLEWNNQCGRKTRLKIATDTVEGCNSFTLCCSMLILGLTKYTGSPESGGYLLLFHSMMLQQCSLSLMNMLLYLKIGFHGQMLLYFQNYHSVLYILSNAKNNELNN